MEKKNRLEFFLFLLLLFSLSNSSQQQKGRSGVYLVSPVFLLLFVFYQPFQKEMALATDITPFFLFYFTFRGCSSSCGLLSMVANRNDPSLSACRRVYISLENNNASSLNLRPLFKHWHTATTPPSKGAMNYTCSFYITSVINATATDHRFWLFIYFYSSRHYFFFGGGGETLMLCGWNTRMLGLRRYFLPSFFFALMLRVTATGRPLHLI